MSTIWSFDLGKGSIGEAVRDLKTNKFLHVESLLIPAEFASTKEATKRRRFMRTRLAHKMREQWLNEVWRAAGQEPLDGRRVGKVDGKWKLISEGDKRLEREFPEKGDSTCYTSCLLRVKLLRGEKLEPWQIYKALHSAIQRRGYDPKIPWKSREDRNVRTKEADDEDKGTFERMNAFQKELRGMIPEREDLQLPCYFDAWKMGLWNPAKPETLKERIDCHAETTRNVIIPRTLVEKEFKLLADQAGKQIVGLAGKADELLYGPSKTAYASYFPELRKKHHLREGGANDWQGVLGQKIPRFDNRIIEKCVLMPRFNVCKTRIRLDRKNGMLPYPESLLAAEVTFLWKLKNMRYAEGGQEKSLAVDEIKELFQYPDASLFQVRGKTWESLAAKFKWQPIKLPAPIKPPKTKSRALTREQYCAQFAKALESMNVIDESGRQRPLGMQEIEEIVQPVIVKSFALTEAVWGKWLRERGRAVLPTHKCAEAPKVRGRSRLSRPALVQLKNFVLSGLSPKEFREQQLELIRTGKLQHNREGDFDGYTPERMGETWAKAYVPNQRLNSLVENAGTSSERRVQAIKTLIAKQTDPIVRHRLEAFWERIKFLEAKLKAQPEQVVLEFVRDNYPESYMGKDSKEEYQQWVNDNRKAAEEAREMVNQLGATGRDAVLKYLLLKAQGFQCIYAPNGTLDVSATASALQNTHCIYTDQPIGISNIDDLVIDHIVPQEGGYNGPDSFINKVVTTHFVNSQLKKCRTPYEWFQQEMPDKWHAYLNRVESRIGGERKARGLGRKKANLLTSPNAKELVQRYTALAETAWISKLAQAVLCLHFGWEFGVDEKRQRKIKVVSGGLTARIRRMYKLNKLLADGRDVEVKNRKDKRHHALDAMVINFIPSWAADENKEHFFKLPPAIHKSPHAFFEQYLSKVEWGYLCHQNPALEETFYGERLHKGRRYAVGRERLLSLGVRMDGFRPVVKKAKDIETKRIIDKRLREDLEALINMNPTLTIDDWTKWCASPRGDDRGPRVVKVLVTKSKPDALNEYVDVGKDTSAHSRPILRRGERHRGYFVYWSAASSKKDPDKRQAAVRPVYIFQSVASARQSLVEHGIADAQYLESGCAVEIMKDVAHSKTPLSPGRYVLNSVWEQGNVVVTSATGQTSAPIGLAHMLTAGLRRID